MQQIVKYSYGYQEQDPSDFIAKIDSPIFLIHEQLDDLVGYQDTLSLYAKAGNGHTSFWEVPGAYHSRAYDFNSQTYLDKVAGFFATTLNPQQTDVRSRIKVFFVFP